jgi:plastocyanin
VLLVALSAAGCGGSSPDNSSGQSSSSGSSSSATTKVDVTVKGDSVTPAAKAMTIAVGDTVELDVEADRSGELHVHSTPEHEFEFDAGTSTFKFTLDQPGTVDVEEHVSESLVLRILVK